MWHFPSTAYIQMSLSLAMICTKRRCLWALTHEICLQNWEGAFLIIGTCLLNERFPGKGFCIRGKIAIRTITYRLRSRKMPIYPMNHLNGLCSIWCIWANVALHCFSNKLKKSSILFTKIFSYGIIHWLEILLSDVIKSGYQSVNWKSWLKQGL